MKQIKGLTFLLAAIILTGLLPVAQCKKQEKIQIVLISIDTLRGDHITPYGYSRDTSPHLSELAKESVYYTHAYTNGCWTMPSHMSLLTGTLPSRHGINKDWSSFMQKKYPGLNDSVKTLSEVLKSHHPGIKTIKFARLPDEIGFDKGFDINYRTDPFSRSERFDKLLEEFENHKKENFLFFIHTWMAHAPYTDSSFLKEGKTGKENRELIDNFRKLDKKTRGKLLGRKADTRVKDLADFLKKLKLFNAGDCKDLYDGGIRFVDTYIGKIIDKTRELGIYPNLMFIVVSDHGEHFGEHRPTMFYNDHGHEYYEEFVKVPLMIKYPRKVKSKKLNHPVSLTDVFPTLLDYYKIGIPAFVQGDSLLKPYSRRNRKYIVSEAVSRRAFERKMLRVGHLKYIVTMKNPCKPGRVNWEEVVNRRLFDLKNDPFEKDDLYKKSKEFRKMCFHLEKLLKKIIENSVSLNPSTKDAAISKETLDHMKSLGYF